MRSPETAVEMQEKKFEIPSGVERAVLMIRHSVAPKTGTDGNKTLTLDGMYLCEAVREFYQSLVCDISVSLNVPTASYHCSTFPRSMMTAWEIFRVPNIQAEESLKVWVSLMSIDGGAWAKAQMAAGKNEPTMIREFLGDQGVSLWTADFDDYQRNYTEFILGNVGSEEARRAKFVVATCHEAGISLAAAGCLLENELGLNNCEAVLFYVSGGYVVGAEKIVPGKASAR